MRENAVKNRLLHSVIPMVGSALLGLILLLGIYHVGTYNCQRDAQRRMDTLIRYVVNQCTLYEDVAAEEEVKSLSRMADKTLELQKNFASRRAEIDTDFMMEYMQDQRLTGMIVTDEEEGTEASCVIDGAVPVDWTDVLQKAESVKDTGNKCYMERILTADGECFDYAVMGRTDRRGIILCYQQQEYAVVRGTQMSIKTLLSKFDFDANGLIVVTDGVTVVGSNDESLNGMRADACDVIRDVRNISDFGSLIPTRANGTSYYAMRGKCKSNYIYVLFPEKMLFMQRSVLFAYSAAIYVVLLMIGIALHGRMDYLRRRERERTQERYRAEMDRLAKDAIRANEVKSDFLRRISHDIRTPVNGISGMIEIAKECDGDPARRRECYEKIQQASEYLLELVSGVLDMSKLEQKDFRWSEEPFDIETEFQSVVTLMTVAARDSKITFRPETGAIVHNRLLGSAVLFKRICLNLIGNALKYTNRGGTVEISLREEFPGQEDPRAWFCFVCRDNGIGMSPDFQPHMFEPFAKEDTSAKPDYSGAGLGLSIVKSLLDTMGGQIDIRSVQGEGTTVTVRFVFAIDRDAGQESVPADAPAVETDEPVLRDCRILLAEDNDLNAEIAVYFLEKAGAEVVWAKDGNEAANVYLDDASGTFDLILMDVMMPGMDGIETAQVIRSSGRADAGTVPIVALTANVYSDDVDRVRRAGMNDCLSKPLDAHKMIAVVARYCNRNKRGKRSI